jgi:two-component system cell cycle response regulator DivK
VTSRRILVVEDNPLNLKLVRDVLRFAGHVVMEAHSGEEGLSVLHEVPPDLVLMDLQLPGIDGAETLRRMRQGGLAPDVPVVAVTAFAMAGDRERAALAGFDGYIEKPISVRALPGQIEAFFAGASEATGLTSGGQE